MRLSANEDTAMLHGKRIAVVLPAYNAASTLEDVVQEESKVSVSALDAAAIDA